VSDADHDVVRKVLGGDREAYATVVERYQHRLFGLAMVIVRDAGMAEEVTQDAFVRAFERLDQFDAVRPLYPWLATITIRVAQNRLRERRRGEQRAASSGRLDSSVSAASALSSMIADEQSLLVWQAVAALPHGERIAALFYYRDALPLRDVAVSLGVSPGTVKTLLFRARQHLRERLRGGEA
jgi:RNA polymerase sigma-70 factor (ECF subfamily)